MGDNLIKTARHDHVNNLELTLGIRHEPQTWLSQAKVVRGPRGRGCGESVSQA
jgi:hypothetical protein